MACCSQLAAGLICARIAPRHRAAAAPPQDRAWLSAAGGRVGQTNGRLMAGAEKGFTKLPQPSCSNFQFRLGPLPVLVVVLVVLASSTGTRYYWPVPEPP